MDRVAITGTSTFVGEALVRRLVTDGRQVRVIVERGDDTKALDGLNVDVVVVDLNDVDDMARALQGCETLYHGAWQYKDIFQQRERAFRTNVIGLTTTLLAAGRTSVRRILYTSSTASLGVHPGDVDETGTFNLFHVKHDYPLSRFLAEQTAQRFIEAGVPVIILNAAFPIGPGDSEPTHMGQYIVGVLKGKIPIFPGGANLIDIDDLVEGHVLAETKGRVGERYILGGTNVTARDLCKAIARIAGVRLPRLALPANAVAALAVAAGGFARGTITRSEMAPSAELVKNYLFQRLFLSTEKARKELGFAPRDLDAALERTITWFRDQGMA